MKIWAGRILRFLLVAVCVSGFELGVNRLTHSANTPAGFIVGVVDGVLMPMAMPALIVGKDMPIYAPNNSGRTYKLGYTMGVNGCGALFFGVVFWRVTRWYRVRKQRATSVPPENKGGSET